MQEIQIPSTPASIVGQLLKPQKWALQNVQGWENFDKLVKALNKGNMIAVTDGSFKHHRGAATWIICDKMNTAIQIEGSLPSPGKAEYQQLATEQYGSRKNHTAILQTLNKRLTMDISMLQKISTVFCSQDAKSCYNRISHAALAMGL